MRSSSAKTCRGRLLAAVIVLISFEASALRRSAGGRSSMRATSQCRSKPWTRSNPYTTSLDATTTAVMRNRPHAVRPASSKEWGEQHAGAGELRNDRALGPSAGTVQGDLARPQLVDLCGGRASGAAPGDRQQASLRVPHSDSGPCGGLSQCIPVSSTEKIPRLSLTRSTATYAPRTERCTVHPTLEQPAPAHAL